MGLFIAKQNGGGGGKLVKLSHLSAQKVLLAKPIHFGFGMNNS